MDSFKKLDESTIEKTSEVTEIKTVSYKIDDLIRQKQIITDVLVQFVQARKLEIATIDELIEQANALGITSEKDATVEEINKIVSLNNK